MKEVNIEKFTHFFKVSEPEPHVRDVLTDFVKHHLLETRLEYQDGRYVKVPGRVFAARTKDKREYRFHINGLDTFTHFFNGRGYKVSVSKDEREDVYPGDDAVFIKPTSKQLRDYQVEVIDGILKPGCSKVVELAMGLGKLLPHYGLSLSTEKRFVYSS